MTVGIEELKWERTSRPNASEVKISTNGGSPVCTVVGRRKSCVCLLPESQENLLELPGGSLGISRALDANNQFLELGLCRQLSPR